MNPSGLRALLIGTLLAVQIGTVAIFVDAASRRATDELESRTVANVLSLADTVAARTRAFLAGAADSLESGRGMIARDLVDTRDDVTLERFLAAHLEAHDWLRGIYLGRADGSFVMVDRQRGGFGTKRVSRRGDVAKARFAPPADEFGRRRIVVDPDDGYDPRTRPWYAKAVATERAGGVSGEIVWTDPYRFFSSSEPGVSAAVRVRSGDGRDAGVLGIDVDIRAFSDFLSVVAGDEDGTAVLVDGARHVIAASRPGLIASDDGGAALPSIGDLSNGSLGGLAALLDEPVAHADGEPHALSDPALLGLKRSLGTLCDCGLDWQLLAQIPLERDSAALGAYFSGRLRTLLGALAFLSLMAMLVVLGATLPLGRLHRDATVDRLTGVARREELERRLAPLVRGQRFRERRERLVAVAVDLDRFKAINDRYGHAAGDVVLARLAKRLRASVGPGNLVGRIGGDEFVLVLRLPLSEDVRDAVERIRLATVSAPFTAAGVCHVIGLTAGVACLERDESMERFVARADRALIRGKAFAKNRVYLAPESTDEGALAVA